PAGRLPHEGDAVLDAEGAARQLLPDAPLARREAAGLADVLARRELLHAERGLRGAGRRPDGVPGRPQRREPEGLDGAPPWAARVLPDRTGPDGVARGDGAARHQAVPEDRRRQQHEVRAGLDPAMTAALTGA